MSWDKLRCGFARIIGVINNVRSKIKFIHGVVISLIICISTLSIVYYMAAIPEITDFNELRKYSGMKVRVVGIVLYLEYRSYENEVYMELYGIDGGICRVYIEYVEDPIHMKNIHVNDIISIEGEVYSSSGIPTVSCPKDNTMVVKGQYIGDVVSIANAIEVNNIGRYLAIEGQISDVGVMLLKNNTGMISAMTVSDSTGSINVRFKVSLNMIPIGSTVKIYGIVNQHRDKYYLQVYASDAVIVTHYYNITDWIPLSAITASPLEYVGYPIKTKGYVVYTPTIYENCTVFYIGNTDGSDYTVPDITIKCVYYCPTDIGLEKGDYVTLKGFVLEYDGDKCSFYLMGLYDCQASVYIENRYGEWSPPIDIICQKPWLFEGASLNIICTVKSQVNNTAYYIYNGNSTLILITKDTNISIKSGDKIRVLGRIKYVDVEGRYVIYAKDIIKF